MEHMIHTVKGKHGHCYRVRLGDSKKDISPEKICISRKEAAYAEYMSKEMQLREELSVKWDVCAWCWKESPPGRGYGINPKTKKKFEVMRQCETGKCPFWGKPYKVPPKKSS